MSWTDERIETLKKMWMDGKSASQIATELGDGITRNAVIGKVHRLGFAGRAKTPNMSAPRARAPKQDIGIHRPPSRGISGGGGSSGMPSMGAMLSGGGAGPMTHGATALAYNPQANYAPAPRPIEDVVVPMSERVTILELRESMCKWPLGDPTSPEFRYCGSPSPIGVSYCQAHARIAYQPAQDRRRDRKPPPR